MRLLNFIGENTEWLTFQNNPDAHYGRHSFFITEQRFMGEHTDFVLPEGYGVKVFKNDDWQGTNITDAAIIQNIFWINNLAPRIIEIFKANFRIENLHNAYLVEIISGTHQKNIEELKRIADENFISINYGGSNLELNNSANWIDGKYIDFGGFKIDKERYWEKLVDKINRVTHYGHLVGDRHISYQSIDDKHIPGKRKTEYRIEKMRLKDIKFNNKSVIDIGCNLGLMMHYAQKNGAKELTGYDLPPVIEVAREYANYMAQFNFNFIAQDLRVTPPIRMRILFSI